MLYQYDLMVVVMLGWFVCPTVSMVITSKVCGMEKTLLIADLTSRSSLQVQGFVCLTQMVVFPLPAAYL